MIEERDGGAEKSPIRRMSTDEIVAAQARADQLEAESLAYVKRVEESLIVTEDDLRLSVQL